MRVIETELTKPREAWGPFISTLSKVPTESIQISLGVVWKFF